MPEDTVSIAPIQDAVGQIIHYVALEEDITDRRNLQESLRRTNAELEQFAYVASHDLRQPLRMITSYLALISRQLEEQMNDEQKGFMSFAIDGAKRMDRLILDLLEYSRTGQSRTQEQVAIGDVVAIALANLTVAIGEAEAEIILTDDLPNVAGSMTELVRLFQNLIGNAIKYRAPEQPPKVEIFCARQGADWLFSIRDNGIGIAREDRERAFAIFQRLVSREQYEGTGIGLAVCKKIVEQHGGRIWIDSPPLEGSIFCFTIPAK